MTIKELDDAIYLLPTSCSHKDGKICKSKKRIYYFSRKDIIDKGWIVEMCLERFEQDKLQHKYIKVVLLNTQDLFYIKLKGVI